jgi:hypothetical protein
VRRSSVGGVDGGSSARRRVCVASSRARIATNHRKPRVSGPLNRKGPRTGDLGQAPALLLADVRGRSMSPTVPSSLLQSGGVARRVRAVYAAPYVASTTPLDDVVASTKVNSIGGPSGNSRRPDPRTIGWIMSKYSSMSLPRRSA